MAKKGQEQYSHGYGSETIQRQESRSAERDAYFLVPHMKSGMKVLDCGCGSGSITFGLAEIVSPGETIGLDVEDSVVERANALAKERGISNIRFQVGSIYELPFPDESFDVVFAHTVLEHLNAPKNAVMEMKRVLKPGGVIGLRDMDTGGVIYSPEIPAVLECTSLVENQMRHNGGDAKFGRRLGGLLREVGFQDVEMFASYSKESPTFLGEVFSNRLLDSPLTNLATEHGWADRKELERIAKEWLRWSQHPDAFYALSRCEAVGWKV